MSGGYVGPNGQWVTPPDQASNGLFGQMAAMAAGEGKVGYVAPATGVPATDAAAIIAAFVAANGGRVEFPSGQTYVVGGKGAQVVYFGTLPSLIDLRGSTIQVRPEVTAATTSAGVSAGATSIPLQAGQGALFQAGDYVSLHSSAYSGLAFASGIPVSAVVGDTLTVPAITFDSSATSVTSGAFVQHDNACMYLQGSASTLTGVAPLTIRNGMFDGNGAARIANGLRQAWSCHSMLHVSGISLRLLNNTFKNAPCDTVLLASAPFFKAIKNHVENGFGNGFHIGGSVSATGDCIVTGNSFLNVTQATGATTPTIDQYQHTYQSGPVCTSNGPFRSVVANNVMDTATRWGFAAVDSNDTDISITGNVFSSCGGGAWHVYSSGKNSTITGNTVKACGRDVPDASGVNLELTAIKGASGGGASTNTTVTGNTFTDSALYIGIDATDVTVVGNTFNAQGLSNVNGSTNTNLTAVIMAVASSGGCKRLTVKGNTISLPLNNNNSLNGISIGALSDSSIEGNTISGGRMGISVGGLQTNVKITGNNLSNQGVASGGTSPHAIYALAASGSRGLDISGNNISVSSTVGAAWIAIDLYANGVTAGTLTCNGNNINISTRPTGGATGIRFNQTAITWSGFQISVNDNFIAMANAADAPIVPPATGATTVHFLRNRMFGGSTPTFTGNTTAIGGGTDSNFYA